MKIILHVCCGPCSIYPVSYLKDKSITPVGFFFNPNIHPFTEFEKRVEASIETSRILGYDINFHINETEFQEWFNGVSINLNRPERCYICYRIRIEKTAEIAKNLDIGNFTTTLLYSIYQDHEKIKEISLEVANKYQLNFFYHDFREGWREGVEKSKELGIYRQSYCGCIFSERERYEKRLKKLIERLDTKRYV